MKITILASGSDGNCCHITDGKTPLLLDAGIGYRQIQTAMDFGIRSLKGCLITHEHTDHTRAVKQLLHSRVPVYMTPGTRQALGLPAGGIKELVPGKPFALGTWQAIAFDTHHDAAQPVGYLLTSDTGGKLLFITDTHYVGYTFRGITHLMIEANFCEKILAAQVAAGTVPAGLEKRLYHTHMNLRRVKEFLMANTWEQLQEIHLLHLSNHHADAALFQAEIQSLTGVPVYIAGEVAAPKVGLYG